MNAEREDHRDASPLTSRFLHLVDGLAGTAHRAFGLAQMLQARGHTATIASPVDLSENARRAVVDFVHLDGTDRRQAVRSSLERPGRSNRSLRTLATWINTGRRLRRESLADDELERVLSTIDPDLVLVDHEFHTAGLVCRAAGRPFVLVSGIFSTIRSASNPPLDTPLVPGVDEAAAIDDAWESTLAVHRSTRARLERPAARVLAPFRPVQLLTSDTLDIAAFARSRGLRLDDEVTASRWLRPFTLDAVPTVSLTPGALEWADPDPAWHTVGLVAPPRLVDRSADADRAALTSLRRRRSEQPGRPLVYASVGTFWTDAERTIRRIVAALATMPEVDSVVGLGSLLDPADLDVPEHVVPLGWAPQSELMAAADLAVLHGGITSIGEALLASTPMVLLPTHTNDQDGTAARARAAGVAVVADHRTATPGQLATLIRSALADTELRRRVSDVSVEVDQESSAELAATLLERLATP